MFTGICLTMVRNFLTMVGTPLIKGGSPLFPPPRRAPRTDGSDRRRSRRYTLAAVAAFALAAAPLAAAGPATASSAARSASHPSVAYMKAHAKYNVMGWELKSHKATSPPPASSVPLLSGVLGEESTASAITVSAQA